MTRPPRITAYTLDAPAGYEHLSLTIQQMGALRDSRVVVDADVWAVLNPGGPSSWCLGRDGTWDMQPQPSSRTDEWLTAHRFTRVEAFTAAYAAMPAWLTRYGVEVAVS